MYAANVKLLAFWALLPKLAYIAPEHQQYELKYWITPTCDVIVVGSGEYFCKTIMEYIQDTQSYQTNVLDRKYGHLYLLTINHFCYTKLQKICLKEQINPKTP